MKSRKALLVRACSTALCALRMIAHKALLKHFVVVGV